MDNTPRAYGTRSPDSQVPDNTISIDGFGEETQLGSELNFATPGSLNLDSLMGADVVSSTTMYPPASHAGSRDMQGFGEVFESGMLAGGGLREQQGGSFSSAPDGQSPIHGQPRRAGAGDNSPFTSQPAFSSRGGGSENASPGGNRGQGQVGEDNQGDGGDKSGKSNEAQEDAIPAWSELKTKAGKERKRLPLACIACRRKKIRCSGEKPACKHCLRSRIPCVYKVTTRKAAPRTDYMAMLDKRLKRMEERVIRIIPKEEQGAANSIGRAVVKPPLPSAPTKPGVKKRGAEAAFSEDLDEWSVSSAVVRTESPPKSGKEERQESLKPQDVEEHGLLEEGADKLPSKEVQEHLSEVFFDYVYAQGYHLLHKPSFMRRLAHGTVPPVLMLAVCAISARFSNHLAVRTEPAFLRGEQWASVAREISLRRYDSPNITILIVYLILGLHEFGTCQGGRSWMFGGMAQRMAYALQLHKDLDHDPKSRYGKEKTELTFTDREIRRRTMWSCFLMDRFNSSGTDRPIFIGEQYIRAQLPIKESYYQMEITGPTEDLEGNIPSPLDEKTEQMANARDNMGVAAYQIRLISIWGKLVNYLNLGGKERDSSPMWAENSTFRNLQRATANWLETLPESLRYNAENLQNHARSRSALSKDMPHEFIQEAARAAHDAANQISALIHEGMDHHVVAPFAGYCTFFSSTVHIYGAFSGNPALQASSKQNLARNVKYLTKMKKHWGMFHFMTENLRDLYRLHADAARNGNKSGNKDGETSIFQYGDWFDRYPHGVSGTDWEEPSTENKIEPGADAVLGQQSDLQTVEEFFSKLTPPTRAAQMQAQQSQRKLAKTRRSKSESKTGAEASAQRQDTKQSQPQQQQQQQKSRQPQKQTQQATSKSPTAPSFSNDTSMFPQQSAAFPATLQQSHNPLLMTTPSQQFMSQLDRQMVLNSYAGINPSSSEIQSFLTPNNHALANTMVQQQGQHTAQSFDFAAFAQNNSANMWEDTSPSTAWFMPFNMEPPAIGDDNQLFSSGYPDWQTLGGFGEMSAVMMPTGLTPGADLGVDRSHDPLMDNEGQGIPDGMDGLQ